LVFQQNLRQTNNNNNSNTPIPLLNVRNNPNTLAKPFYKKEDPREIATAIQVLMGRDPEQNPASRRCYAQVYINKVPVEALIDSGADITIITLETFQKLGVPLLPYLGPAAETASNARLTPLGRCNVNITYYLADQKAAVDLSVVVVEKLPADLPALLGNDANSKVGLCINLSTGELSLAKETPGMNLVHLKEDLFLNARSSRFVSVVVSDKPNTQTDVLMTTDDLTYHRNNDSLPNSLVSLKDGATCVEITNFSTRVVSLKQGAIIGTYENLEEKEILVNTVANNDEPHDTLEKGLAAKQENSKDSDEITEHALEDIKVSQSTKCRPAIDLINSVSSHFRDKTIRIRSIRHG